MSIVFFLIPLGLGLVAIAAWAFVWAVNHDQFEDLDKAAHSILFDDDEAQPGKPEREPKTSKQRDSES
jgi:cbb3-type cytochrome oxidase maturation protein